MSEPAAAPSAAPSATAPSASAPPPSRPTGAPADPNAWQRPRQPFDPLHKSPRRAAFLSIAPGLGQVYVGYYSRGVGVIAGFLLLTALSNIVPQDIAPVFGFSAAFLWAFNIIDAGRMAALYNHAVEGAGAIEMPADFVMPGPGGSVAGGALMLLFGLVAFSNTALGIELDWLATWWPLFPIGMGGYLLLTGLRERG